jgi:hypothetical protein
MTGRGARQVVSGARAGSALVVALASGSAAAATITVDFNVPPAEEVGYLCVAYDGKVEGGGAVGTAAPFPNDYPPATRQLLIGDQKVHLADGRTPATEMSGAWKDIDAAFAEMARRSGPDKKPPQDTCGEHAGFCAPRLPIPPPAKGKKPVPLSLMCAANRFAPGKRVVILKPSFQRGLNPPLRGVTLFGGTGVLEFSKLSNESGKQSPQATVGVFGGDYDGPGGTSSPDGQLKLTLAARCAKRELRLPRMAPGEAHRDRQAATEGDRLRISVRPSGGSNKEECTSPFGAGIPLMLPRGERGPATRVDVTAEMPKAAGAGLAFESRFGVDWRDAEPPVSLDAGVSVMQFQWRAGCEYLDISRAKSGSPGTAKCPSASIVEAGAVCNGDAMTSGPSGPFVCAYTCAPVVPEIALPVTIRFEIEKSQDSWLEKLSAVGQTLSGYTDRQHRYFPVRFEEQNLESRGPADKIDHVRLATSSGEASVFRPRQDGSYRIALPGGTCGDELEYQYVGDGDFGRKSTRVQDGAVVVPAPAESERRFYPAFALGGGLLAPGWGDEQVEPFAVLALQLRWYVPGRWSLPLVARPFTPLVSVRYAYTFGRQHYVPAYGTATREDVPFQRHFATVPVGAFFTSWLRLEVAPGIVFNEPLLFEDSPRAGAPFWIPTVGVHAGFRLSRRVELQGSLAWLFGDRVFGFRPRNDGNPILVVKEETRPVLSLELLFRP